MFEYRGVNCNSGTIHRDFTEREPDPHAGMRQCSACGEWKQDDEFARYGSDRGYRPKTWCKACSNRYQREWKHATVGDAS